MGDTGRGRLFRLTTSAVERYQSPAFSVNTVEEALAALQSPNEARRYLAWLALMKSGRPALPGLQRIFENRKLDSAYRARAFWAAARLLKEGDQAASPDVSGIVLGIEVLINYALEDPDQRIRETAFRGIRTS